MFNAKFAAEAGLSSERPNEPLKLAFAAIRSSAETASVRIRTISFKNSVIALSVTSLRTFADAPKVALNSLTPKFEYAP